MLALLGLALLAGAMSVRQATHAPAPAATRRPARTPTPCDKCGKDRSRPTPTRAQGTGVGQEAPDFGVPDLSGETVQLSDYRGQVVLLNFWASWCGPCRMEVPGLVALYGRYRDRGLAVLAVNLGEPREQVESFADAYQMTFPVLLDMEGQTRYLYPTRGIPTSLILDREGVVRNVLVGSADEETFTRLIEPLLEAQ